MIKKILISIMLCAVIILFAAHNDEAIAASSASITKSELEIGADSVTANVTVEGSGNSSMEVYVAVYNRDKTLSSVQTKDVSIGSAFNPTSNISFVLDDFNVSLGMYAVCYVWDEMTPLCEKSMFDWPNSLEYGSYVFEAESILTSTHPYAQSKSESGASGGKVIYFTAHRWDTDDGRPASDGTDDGLLTTVNVDKGKSGEYVLWFRYKLLSNAQGSFIWYRYNDINYARRHMNGTIDGVYRWASISLNLKEGSNTVAFSSGVPSHIDKFILTNNINFTPVGINDRPPYVTNDILEHEWASLWEKPPVTPPAGHPRLYITPEFIPTLKENLASSENGWMYDKFKTNYAYEELNCRLDTALANNHNSYLLVKIMSRALVYVIGDETDINHAKQTISYMRDYLDTVRTPGDEADITRIRGDILVAAAVVYDWCYDALSDDDKSYFKNKFIEIAASKEIGWPPKAMSSVASHAGEQEIFRDLLAAGIAIYDEYPLFYDMTAGRMFEEMVPSREWFRATGRSEYGNDYAECRAYSELWADMTFRRMGYDDVSVYGNASKEPLSWLIHSRMPYGVMMPYGDMYTATRSSYKYYDRNYMLSYLLASNLYQSGTLKQEFMRRFNLMYAGEDIQFWYCIFNDPDIKASISTDEPLAKETTYPLSSILHKTSHQEGFDSDAAIGFMNMHEVFVGDHQNIYTGDFQIYYKGLLAMNTGTYNASTQHNEGYKRRAIAGNTMLCYDPSETFVPTRSNVSVPNDGGQRTPYLKADGTSKGSAVAQFSEFETNENGIAQNRDLIVSENVKKYIGPNKKTPLYSYVSGDLSNAYSDKVTYYKRSMVFADLANDTYPAAFVVYDKMISSNASFKKTWLMHSQEEPTVAENLITITRTQNGFDGKLVDNVLLPQSNSIEVVGGYNNEMFTVGGLEMPPKANAVEGGNYRIELSPKDENLEDEFLNVMYVTDASGNAEHLESSKLETDLFIGASIYDRAILFAKAETVDSGFNLNIKSDFDKTHILIADVAEGIWNISGDDININIEVKDGENVLYAELPNGYYTFSPTSESADAITYDELTKRPLGAFVIWENDINADSNGTNYGNFIYQAKPTVLSGGVPCIPLETLSQFEAEYVHSNGEISITKNGKTAFLTTANTSATIDGTSKTLSKAPFTQNGTVYVPICDLGDFLGYEFKFKSSGNMLVCNPYLQDAN